MSISLGAALPAVLCFGCGQRGHFTKKDYHMDTNQPQPLLAEYVAHVTDVYDGHPPAYDFFEYLETIRESTTTADRYNGYREVTVSPLAFADWLAEINTLTLEERTAADFTCCTEAQQALEEQAFPESYDL